jgi:hypothetical protein
LCSIGRSRPGVVLSCSASESYLGIVHDLLLSTNNFDELQDELTVGYSVLTAFQQFDVNIANLRMMVNDFAENGRITNKGIATSLLQKLKNFERKMTDGNFDAAAGLLGAFVNQLQAQRGKHIADDAAAALLGFAEYSNDLIGNGNSVVMNEAARREVAAKAVAAIIDTESARYQDGGHDKNAVALQEQVLRRNRGLKLDNNQVAKATLPVRSVFVDENATSQRKPIRLAELTELDAFFAEWGSECGLKGGAV